MRFFLFLCVSFIFTTDANALPKCEKVATQTSYIASWRKVSDTWDLAFTCTNGTQAKLSFENLGNGAEIDNLYFITTPQGDRDGEEVYNNACEGIKEYCETSLDMEEDTSYSPLDNKDLPVVDYEDD